LGGAASGADAEEGGARGVRDGALTENVLLSPCLKLIYSKILY
jgi:hypothetical protein